MITTLTHLIDGKMKFMEKVYTEIEKNNFGDPTKGTFYLENDLVQKLMQPIFDNIKINYRVSLAWVHFMAPGASHTMHNHQHDIGVYYLKIPKDSGNLVFEDSEIIPRDNLFVLIPAEKKHSMATNNSNKNRITMAMDLQK